MGAAQSSPKAKPTGVNNEWLSKISFLFHTNTQTKKSLPWSEVDEGSGRVVGTARKVSDAKAKVNLDTVFA